ncbi:hypothetical protein NQ314_008744 [Rhamnusium bicolor]|uniref:Uncharacterized protein n=1 Tax=Rhamnusium bicolor TaxID=1586634 RepID=A0AAV8Y7R4_9CUCU|nr:hypothetical protein NQ314_008744 [Rhamnusium bicolor]
MKIDYEIIDLTKLTDDMELLIYSEDKNIASLEKEIVISNPQTVISCRNKKTDEIAEGNLDVVVIRKKRIVDILFTASVATLVSILYINFGCAIDWGELRNILKRPIGPTIGFFGQFFVMPLLSYGLGLLLFPDSPEMQLGMFFTGVSPAGGASNVWAVLLEGNISLSIIMTAISTIAAFGMMPLWLFTLGRFIFRNANLEVPYSQILTYIIVAGMALPWLGYVAGYLLAKVFNQTPADCITIAIEVGIQNTGIAIFLLRFALPQPQADLTTVAPVAVATLTPFPLLFLFLYKKLQRRLSHSHSKLNCYDDDIPKINNNCNGNIEAFKEVKLDTVT